tara:strand:+ start:562 stop:1398 length:837 start_codon:yes stop_codon:yes gene_type:complete
MDTLTIDYNDPMFSKKFVDSLHHTGFAVINEHPIDQKLINKVYRDWDTFFKSERKHDYIYDYEKQDGYFPFRSENAYDREKKDLKEFFHIYPLWGRYPNFISKDTLNLFNMLSELGNTLLLSIEHQTPNEIRGKYTEPLNKMSKNSSQNLMRVIHYPPIRLSDHPDEIRAGAHTDINLITLLVSGSQPGLQVKNKSGDWVDIKSEKGQIVINIGDMLQEASSGYFPSTIHRVINPKNTQNLSRYSIPLFLHPRPEVILSDRYTADSYLLERLKEIGLK